jgi:hypothetical protein
MTIGLFGSNLETDVGIGVGVDFYLHVILDLSFYSEAFLTNHSSIPKRLLR